MSQAIIVAGQSNALGYHVTPEELPAAYKPDPNVVIWNMAESRWDMMVPGVNTGTPANPNAWGPEVGYAMAWTKEHPDEILYVVKQVKGETPLAQAEGLDWSPDSRGELFDQTAAQVAASHIGHTTVLYAQGEQDGYDLDAARAYRDNLAELKEAAADLWNADRFLVAQSVGPGPYNYLVQSGQGADSFSTAEIAKQDDGIHYSGEGQLELGQAFYDDWIGL